MVAGEKPAPPLGAAGITSNATSVGFLATRPSARVIVEAKRLLSISAANGLRVPTTRVSSW